MHGLVDQSCSIKHRIDFDLNRYICALVTWSADDVSAPSTRLGLVILVGAYDLAAVRAGSDTYAPVTACRDADLGAFHTSDPESPCTESSMPFLGTIPL